MPHCIRFFEESVGEIYYGEFKDGEFDEGVWESGGGVLYVGGFTLGRKNGNGILKDAEESLYQGEFQNDLPHGIGTQKDVSGSRYYGAWQSGMMHGQGKLDFGDGILFLESLKMEERLMVFITGRMVEHRGPSRIWMVTGTTFLSRKNENIRSCQALEHQT